MRGKIGKLFLSIPLALVFLMMAFSSYASEVTIKAGTPIPVRLQDAVSSETATAGQTVRFMVTKDVFV